MVSTMANSETVTIPAGYKQTEVGVKNSSGTNFNDACGGPQGGGMDSRRIPEDWSIKTIGAALTIRHGRDQKQVQCSDGVYPILGTGGEMGRSNTFIYDKPSVLIGRKGSINKPRFMDTPFWTVDTLFYSEVNAKYSAKFLFYKFCMIDWMNYNEASGVPSLNSTTIESVFLSYPKDKQEQEIIANALSDVDSLIASLETLIAKKSAIKTAAMQQLLTGKKRLPAFEKQGIKASENKAVTDNEQESAKQGSDQLTGSGSKNQATQPKASNISDSLTKSTGQTAPRPGYKQTELGEIPEDWEVVGLGYLFENKVIRKRISGRDDVTFISMQDVSESAKINNSHKVKYADVKSGFTYFERNDVLVAKITPCFENGKGAYTDILETEVGFGSTEFHVLRATPNVDSKYLYYFTNTERFRKELEGEMVGSAGHRRVPLSSIQNYQVAISLDKEEQTAIANVLSDMDTELDALQQRLEKIQSIKQGMMQELLTGKTRLIKPLGEVVHE